MSRIFWFFVFFGPGCIHTDGGPIFFFFLARHSGDLLGINGRFVMKRSVMLYLTCLSR